MGWFEELWQDETTRGILIGSGIALFGTILGNLVAPFLLEGSKRRAAEKAEERAERKLVINELQEMTLTLANHSPDRRKRSRLYKQSLDEYFLTVNKLRIGRGLRADARLQRALARLPYEVDQSLPQSSQWGAITSVMQFLRLLIKRPWLHRVVVILLERGIDASSQQWQKYAEEDRQMEAAEAESVEPGHGGQDAGEDEVDPGAGLVRQVDVEDRSANEKPREDEADQR